MGFLHLFRCFLNKCGLKNTLIVVLIPKEFSYEIRKMICAKKLKPLLVSLVFLELFQAQNQELRTTFAPAFNNKV